MGLNKFFKSRKTIFLIGIGITLIVFFQIFRIFAREHGFIMIIAGTLLDPYLSLAESLANSVIKLMVDGITIQNHKIIFTAYPEYFLKHKYLVENWQSYLLNWKWSLFLFMSFWLALSSLKKKITFTFFLLLVHFFAVVAGLVLIAGIGPLLVNSKSLSELRPNAFGTVANFMLFAVWVKKSKSDIELSLAKIKINFKLPSKKINEILVAFFVIILIQNFFIPFFNYYLYIDFLLRVIKLVVFLLGYQAEINGAYLIGPFGGTLFLDKTCLGFITMFIFAALVYLTRRDNKITWKYVLFGIIILHVLNIARLSLLFIFVQYHNDNELIIEHHDMYNIVVYLIIFVLWVIWFEKYNKITKVQKKDSVSHFENY